jgi:hypothetical protein
MKRVALALFILTLVVTGAVAKQTCKEMADEKKLGAYHLARPTQMTRTDRCHYRGYEIVPQWQWSSWSG